MFRQTAFGIALSTLVLASGLSTSFLPARISIGQSRQKASPLVPSTQAALSATIKTTAIEKSVFDQINQYRVSHGLPKLSLNANISRQARIHSQNMANGKTPFSHSEFPRRVNAISLRYKSAAENLAVNQGYTDPASQAVIGWINSPSHLQNLKGNFNLTGIGVAANSQGEVYLTQIFLRSR